MTLQNLVSLITHSVAHTLFNSLTVRLDTCLNPNTHLVSHASTKVSFDRLFLVGFLVPLIFQWLPELPLLGRVHHPFHYRSCRIALGLVGLHSCA